MTKKRIIFFLLLTTFISNIYSQQTAIYTSDLLYYQKALSLYNNQQYLAAQAIFNKIKNTTSQKNIESDCAYYAANCAIRLNQRNADDLIENFVENYPTSTKKNSAFVDVATYYFENGKYAYAQKWYKKVDETSLSNSERETYNFNKGYVAFTTKNYKEAKKYLTRVEASKKYGSQAKYYIGFMAYQGDNYDEANTYFDQVKNQEKYKEKLSYYQADLNFKLGKFNKAIELAKQQLDKSNANEVSQLSKIIGESYFNLEQYSDAIPYLTKYKGTKGKWNNTDYYQLGYAYYKQKNYNKAISEFNKIIDGKNTVAQNAYYHLGESYINLNKKQEALNAFRNASQMNFDKKIQEDAWLNYAKISYEIGNPYQSVPQVLSSYLDKYPKTTYKTEIENLLVDSYITSKNYKEALQLLKGKTNAEHKAAYQKVAFYRGIELFNEGNYTEAKTLFKNAIKTPQDPIFKAKATFWKAETDYNLTNYNEALTAYKTFKETGVLNTEEAKNIDYNIAYTYFKQKNYTQAIQQFNAYINTNPIDKLRLNDAHLRLADGYFVSSNYNQAINSYNKAIAIGEIETDYAFFQKAISYGYLGQENTKITELEAFISKHPNSKLRDDAMYALGNTYVKARKTDKAIETYNRLISAYNNSPFISNALLRQGLIYYNKNESNNALTKFKTVAKTYPNSPEANQAVATARLIYIDLGQVDAYANWVKTLDYVEVTNADLDNATYQSAEKQYLDNNTSAAIKQFNKYLTDFKNGLHANQAHFYLAQLYFKTNKKQKAAPHYHAVVNASKSEFTEEALLRLSQITLDNKDWTTAIPVLKRLETEANFPQNSLFAQSNLMQANYQLNNYNEAVLYAEKVLSKPNLDNKIKSDAQVIIARSAIKTGDQDKAKIAYAQVELTATGETAAEALYYNAYFKNKEKQYQSSLEQTQRLVKDYSSYRYYGAKALIIMAKNQYALNDAFQATYILESIPKNFSEYEDVVEEAAQELSKIKAEQAKTNASIETED